MIDREPVRLTMYIAGLVVGLGVATGFLSMVDVIDAKSILGSISAGLGAFAPIAFGAELARAKAWAPATVAQIEDSHASEIRQVMDAEFVIARAEGGRADPPVP